MSVRGLLHERKPMTPRPQRRHGGEIAVPKCNQRGCSDRFEFRCGNGEPQRVTFVLDWRSPMVQSANCDERPTMRTPSALSIQWTRHQFRLGDWGRSGQITLETWKDSARVPGHREIERPAQIDGVGRLDSLQLFRFQWLAGSWLYYFKDALQVGGVYQGR